MPTKPVLMGLLRTLDIDLSEFVESADLYLSRLSQADLLNEKIHRDVNRQMERCARMRRDLIDLARTLGD